MPSALLIIDVQQGLCEGENPAYDATAVIDRINRLATRVRKVGAPVIFIQHESSSGRLVYESPGWQLAQGLQVAQSDIRIRKTTPDAFNRTDLDAILKRHNVTELIICGMHTEFCVDTTTRRALALGYPVTLVADAHTSAGNTVLTPQQIIGHHNETLANMTSFGPRASIVPSASLKF